MNQLMGRTAAFSSLGTVGHHYESLQGLTLPTLVGKSPQKVFNILTYGLNPMLNSH